MSKTMKTVAVLIAIVAITMIPMSLMGSSTGDSTYCTVHYSETDGIEVTFMNGTTSGSDKTVIEMGGELVFTAYSEIYDLSLSGITFFEYYPTTGETDTEITYTFSNYETPYRSEYTSYFTIYGVDANVEMVFTNTIDYTEDPISEEDDSGNETTPETISYDTESSYDLSLNMDIIIASFALLVSLTLLCLCVREYLLASKTLEDLEK